MAMYYQSSSSEIQGGDGVQTLYLMNPNYVGGGGGGGYSSVSDNQPNMLFFNPPAAAAAMPQPHHFVDPTPRHHLYTTWGTATLVDDDMPQQTPRGLSLSLSAHHKTAVSAGDRDHFPAGQIISPSKNCSSSPSLTTTESITGVNTMQSAVIMGSKYLKAAQELLDEVVNVGNSETKTLRPDKPPPPPPKIIKEDKSGGAAAAELSLTTAQRQEIQMKKAKLNSMLDEVEQRCRQYNQQMQVIVASFEQAAGIGTAKSYTQLALKTILKQFRCLKSTISAQIKGLNKSLGEEEGSDNKSEGPTRLRFVDHQLRQQRALQQLGMMQNSAWRPQRGLPERAVSVLRAWLFEHFLHPYPKDSDKQMLAKQTGLTRSQVSNWFINARVRLWKPMVEEMYLEETKNNQNQIPNDGGAASIKPEPDNKTPRPTAPPPPPPPEMALPARTNFAQLISSLNMENIAPEKSPKKPRNASSLSADDHDHDQATAIKRFSSTEINYLSMPAAAANDHVSRYVGADQQLAAGGFGVQGNGFSLSLALPPTDHHQSQHNFLSHRNFELVDGGGIGGGEGGAAAAASHPSIAYEILDFQSRKPFPAQLLPDFVS